MAPINNKNKDKSSDGSKVSKKPAESVLPPKRARLASRENNPTAPASKKKKRSAAVAPMEVSEPADEQSVAESSRTSEMEEGVDVVDEGDEGSERFSDSDNPSDDDEFVSSVGDRALGERFGFKSEYLEQVARKCDGEVVEAIMRLCRQLVKTQETVSDLRRVHHIFGITSEQEAVADNRHRASLGADPLPPRVKEKARVVVGVTQCERLPAKFTAQQLAKFAAYVRNCDLSNADDDTCMELLSQAAIDTISDFFVANEIVGDVDPYGWLGWDGVELADQLAKIFENPDSSFARGHRALVDTRAPRRKDS